MSLIHHFEADFLWKVSLKILNSGLILKTFTNVVVSICMGKSIRIQRVNIVHSDTLAVAQFQIICAVASEA